jgi:hypothetical protein
LRHFSHLLRQPRRQLVLEVPFPHIDSLAQLANSDQDLPGGIFAGIDGDKPHHVPAKVHLLVKEEVDAGGGNTGFLGLEQDGLAVLKLWVGVS